MAKRKKKVSTRTTKKKTSARKRRTSAPKKETTIRKQLSKKVAEAKKDLLPLLKAAGSTSPSDTALQDASKVIRDTVLTERETPLTRLDKLKFVISCELAGKSVSGYSTIDTDHISKIRQFTQSIETYVDDKSQKQPKNFLMLASPGSGKSHFIKCVARQLRQRNVGHITFNMASLQSNDDLIPPLDAARNLKVEDKIPLLFLDEFDSHPRNFALLLPLLWDGGLNVGQRDLRLGKVVIVLAGSDPSLPETMDHARSMRKDVPINDDQSPKIVDLFSRINGGVLTIPPFLDVAKGIDRTPDKICIAIHLLKSRFGSLLQSVPSGLLKFVGAVQFRYGVRSVAHLINTIPFSDKITDLDLNNIGLPFESSNTLKNSSLAYHFVDDDQSLGILKLWNDSFINNQPIPIQDEFISTFPFYMFTQEEQYTDTLLENIILRMGLDG